MDVEKKERQDVQETVKYERLAWVIREKSWDRTRQDQERALLQAQRSSGAGGGIAVATSGGGAESSTSEFRVYLEAAAVDRHRALITCRHVAITLGGKEDSIRDMQITLEAHPLAALLDPAERLRRHAG